MLAFDRLSLAAIGFVLIAAILVAWNIRWDFIATLDFTVVLTYVAPIWKGLLTTLGITFASLALGLVSGVFLAIAFQSGNRVVRGLVIVHTELWRNTPLLVQVFWIHFALPSLTGISTSILVSGIIALTLQASAYLAEVVRGGIAAVPSGQRQAGDALGLGPFVLWTRIILPQALRIMLPPLVNTAFSFFKGTTILSILGVSELMKMGNIVATYSHKPIEVLTTVGVVYLIIGYTFNAMADFIERRFG